MTLLALVRGPEAIKSKIPSLKEVGHLTFNNLSAYAPRRASDLRNWHVDLSFLSGWLPPL